MPSDRLLEANNLKTYFDTDEGTACHLPSATHLELIK